jgi:hypothetical protein
MVTRLGDKVVKLHIRLRTFERPCMPHDLLMGVAVAVEFDIGLVVPFRVRDEFMSLPAAQKLFRNTALLLNHERRAFGFPDVQRLFHLGWIDLDMNEPDDRYYGLLELTS